MTDGPITNDTDAPQDAIRIGTHTLNSRLIVGTGKYKTFEIMQQALKLSGADCVTVAVRRERLLDGDGRNILDYIDLRSYLSTGHPSLFVARKPTNIERDAELPPYFLARK